MDKIEKAIRSDLDYWIPVLGLSEWELEIEFTTTTDAASAEVTPEEMYDSAVIKFYLNKFENKDEKYRECSVIHELLHLKDRDRAQIAQEIEHSLNPEVWKLYDRVMYLHTEGFIDRIATILYNLRYSV